MASRRTSPVSQVVDKTGKELIVEIQRSPHSSSVKYGFAWRFIHTSAFINKPIHPYKVTYANATEHTHT